MTGFGIYAVLAALCMLIISTLYMAGMAGGAVYRRVTSRVPAEQAAHTVRALRNGRRYASPPDQHPSSASSLTRLIKPRV